MILEYKWPCLEHNIDMLSLALRKTLGVVSVMCDLLKSKYTFRSRFHEKYTLHTFVLCYWYKWQISLHLMKHNINLHYKCYNVWNLSSAFIDKWEYHSTSRYNEDLYTILWKNKMMLWLNQWLRKQDFPIATCTYMFEIIKHYFLVIHNTITAVSL